MKLDKWDNYLIRSCKKDSSLIAEYMAQTWRWRCALKPNYTQKEILFHSCHRLIEIIEGFEIATMSELALRLTVEEDMLGNYHEDKYINRLISAVVYFIGFKCTVKSMPVDFYWGARWGKKSDNDAALITKDTMFTIMLDKTDIDSELFYGTLEQYDDCFGPLGSIQDVREYEEAKGNYFTFKDVQKL